MAEAVSTAEWGTDEADSMACDAEPEKTVEELAEMKKQAANAFYAQKQYKEALSGYNEVIGLCPGMARHYGNRAACYMMRKQYRDAQCDAKKSIELDPRFVKGYLRLMKCSLILGDIIEAQTTLSKFLELFPNSKAITAEKKDLEYVKKYLEEADAAYAVQDFRKVVYCMDRCLDIGTSCNRFKLSKAECLVLLGRYQEAQHIVNTVLYFEKQNADAIYIRGMCLYFQDNVDSAFTHFQQVLKLAPDHTKALNIYKRAKFLKKKKEEGNAAFKAEQYQEAYKLYNEALSIDPQAVLPNAKLHFNKATVAAKLGRTAESVEECTKALKLDENYLKALLRRASSYMNLKQYEEAVRDLENALKIDKSRENKFLLREAKLAMKKAKRKDYYNILGIDKNASTDDIKKAYKKMAMVHHPDRHANASDGERKNQEKKFKDVGEAYGILSDPKKRWRYDNGYDMEDNEGGFHDIDPNAVFQSYFTQQDYYEGCFSSGGGPTGYTFHFH